MAELTRSCQPENRKRSGRQAPVGRSFLFLFFTDTGEKDCSETGRRSGEPTLGKNKPFRRVTELSPDWAPGYGRSGQLYKQIPGSIRTYPRRLEQNRLQFPWLVSP